MTDDTAARPPREALADLIHSPNRLAIIAVLNRVQRVTHVGLSESGRERFAVYLADLRAIVDGGS
ncbi:hypothetical protein ACH4SP_14455 [Streptomyces sp. NPDC021093]|uniref:hypothetical protein n=1 Tax=Streptomyces sp. NPDC021093 TaxID=3365112 RepID=UPI00378C21BA